MDEMNMQMHKHQNKDKSVRNKKKQIELQEALEFDRHFPDGIFAIPFTPDTPRVKLRAMLNYCKSVGKTPEQLSDEERELFWDRD